MCGDLCPSGAICFEIDHEGFWYPAVNKEICGGCGICVKRCPIINETINEKARTPAVYAAWIKNDDIRVKSTSGGLYYALAETALKDGAYIAGCVFSNDWKSALHSAGNTYDDLDKIYRSKYFQSDTAGIYGEVKKLLSDGKKILFCGTPCHNAALMEFLGEDYESLIKCDFVCRGINSPKAHQAHVKELEQRYDSEVSFFNFKNKSQGWTRLGTLVKFNNGKTDFKNRYSSAWTRGYIGSNLYMRPSCEHCKFKKIPRVSDISIADFWGLQKDAENMKKGMSLVMINTEKGAAFYEQTLSLIHSEQSTLEIAASGNGCIYNATKFNHKKRSEFFKRIENERFSDLVFDLEGTSRYNVFFYEKLIIFAETLKAWKKWIINTAMKN